MNTEKNLTKKEEEEMIIALLKFVCNLCLIGVIVLPFCYLEENIHILHENFLAGMVLLSFFGVGAVILDTMLIMDKIKNSKLYKRRQKERQFMRIIRFNTRYGVNVNTIGYNKNKIKKLEESLENTSKIIRTLTAKENLLAKEVTALKREIDILKGDIRFCIACGKECPTIDAEYPKCCICNHDSVKVAIEDGAFFCDKCKDRLKKGVDRL